VERSHRQAPVLEAVDDLRRLSAVTPPPDLTHAALATILALVVVPLLVAPTALALHPLTVTPDFLVPALGAPAVTAFAVARWRSESAVASATFAVAAATSTLVYLFLFAAFIAMVRAVGALVLPM
jgi:hypothetical protein